MTPKASGTILPLLTVQSTARLPSRTYRVDWEAGRVRGMADGREAMGQAVRKALSTERFSHVIYSWSYGMEWNTLLGKDRTLVESELKRLLQEGLEQDGRIEKVSQVGISWPGRRCCAVSVQVETIFGAVREELTVHV